MIAVVFIALRFIRNLGAFNIGIALVFLVSGRASVTLLAVGTLVAVIGLIFTLLAWWRFTFTIVGEELLVTKGVVAQERLTIPLDRVQSVSIDQRFLHRIVGLVSAKVDTAGSSNTEFEIDALERPKAEALQRLVAEYRREAPAPDVAAGAAAAGVPGSNVAGGATGPEEHLVARTWSDLVRIGVARWPWAGLVALGPLIALADDLSDILPFDIPEDDPIGDRLPTEFGIRLIGFVLIVALIVLVAGALLGTILQVIREVVTNWDLRLTRTPAGLRRTAGLLSKTSRSSTITRIQGIQTDRTPMQRLLGIMRLTLPTIGDGDIDVPGTNADELQAIRTLLFGTAAGPELDRRISHLAIFLAVRNQTLIAVPVAAFLVWRYGPLGLLVLLLIPWQWLLARRKWRLRRWSLSRWRIAESYELINQHTAEFDLLKTQTVTVGQSFFERRRGLATVKVTTADGYLAVPLIPLEIAKAVRDRALYAAESDRRPWM